MDNREGIMTEEKKRGRPKLHISGVEPSQHKEWSHPPMQGHDEDTAADAVDPPVVDEAAEKSDEPDNISITSDADSSTTEDDTASNGCPPGWFAIDTAPKDKRIVVSESGEDQVAVYWRIRRVVDKKNLRYLTEGKWTEHLTRLDIDFIPRYWRPYVASDYIPVPRAK